MPSNKLNIPESVPTGSDTMTKKQFLSMMKCESCFLEVKEEFLYSNPGENELFEDILKITDQQLDEISGYAAYVLRDSEHQVVSYPGEYDQDSDYMTIKGFRGVYVAFNDDVQLFFSTSKEAQKYAAEGFKNFKKSVWGIR